MSHTRAEYLASQIEAYMTGGKMFTRKMMEQTRDEMPGCQEQAAAVGPAHRNGWFVWDRRDPRGPKHPKLYRDFRMMDRIDPRREVLI